MQNLAVYAYNEYRSPGVMKQASYDRAWAAALTLIADRHDPQPRRPPDLPPLQNRDPIAVEGRRARPHADAEAQPGPRPRPTTAGRAPAVPTTGTQPDAGAAEAALGTRQAKTLEAREVNLYYGDFHAVEDVTHDDRAEQGDGADRLLGLRQDDLPALAQPHARADPGASVEGEITLDGAGHLRARASTRSQVRRLVGMVFQSPNPFPTMSIYDNVAAGLNLNAEQGQEVRQGRRSSSAACAAPTSGTRSRTGSTSPAPGSPAASSSGSASPARSRSSPRCC